VAGIVGYSARSLRISGSKASTSDPFRARVYFGGSDDANADLTVFLAIPNLLEISLIGTPSLLCKRRISAHCSTAITLPGSGGVKLHPSPGGQYSRAVDNLAMGATWRRRCEL
jgi:hypothetical protein